MAVQIKRQDFYGVADRTTVMIPLIIHSCTTDCAVVSLGCDGRTTLNFAICKSYPYWWKGDSHYAYLS